MPLNAEKFFTKEERQARVAELKRVHTPHVCQHTNCEKGADGKWVSTYHVTYPPQMATLADIVARVSDPNDPVTTSEPLPDTQAIAAAEGEGMVPAPAVDEYQSAT